MRQRVRITFAGDPELDPGALPTREVVERCLYATAVLRRAHPRFAGDLRRLRCGVDLCGAVTFAELRRCRRTTAHPDGLIWVTVAVVTLPIGPAGRPGVDLCGGRSPPAAIEAASSRPALPPGATEAP